MVIVAVIRSSKGTDGVWSVTNPVKAQVLAVESPERKA